jgi:hypothetical protein
MLPSFILPSVHRRDAAAPPRAQIWVTPFVFIVPCMVAAGAMRVLAPWAASDMNRYLAGLNDLLKHALSEAVKYEEAVSKRSPSRPPTAGRRGRSARDTSRPPARRPRPVRRRPTART